jgi:hypothetical protein
LNKQVNFFGTWLQTDDPAEFQAVLFMERYSDFAAAMAQENQGLRASPLCGRDRVPGQILAGSTSSGPMPSAVLRLPKASVLAQLLDITGFCHNRIDLGLTGFVDRFVDRKPICAALPPFMITGA